MKSRALTLLLLLTIAILPKLFSQNVGINSTGGAPDASAMLDVSSTSKGFLMPRMTSVQRDAITSPATGLTIFNTTIVAYQVNTGTPATPVWSTLSTGGSGTVTSVSVTSANGVTGTVATPTTTPAISLTLGAITPSSVTASGTVTGSNLSGTNTGDESLATIKSKLGITTLSGSNTGDQTITLTGNVTGTGTGSFPATIAPNAVTYAKMQAVSTTSKLLGSSSATTPVQEITLGTGLSMAGTTLNATASSGTVTSVSVTSANGVSGSVTTPTTTPAISLTLGAITPSSVAASGTVTGSNLSGSHSGTSSGTNTGDETTATIRTKLGTASATTDGYLTLADWNTFNDKAATTDVISSLNGLTANAQTFAIASLGTAPSWGSSVSVHTLRIPLASTATVTAGLLSNADYTTFNNKLSTSRTISTTSPLQGGGDLTVDRTLSILDAEADGTTKGAAAFTAADFNSTSGVIGIDYTNGQDASSSNKGFLTSADWNTFNNKPDATNIWSLGGNSVASTQTIGTTTNFDFPFITNNTEKLRLTTAGKLGIGTTNPTAILHLKAGTTAANTAPLKFTSGSLMTTAEAGGVEFLTDKFYGTITTGVARKEFTLNNGTLTSGRVPFATTNGRLTDLAAFTYVTNRLSPTYITLGAGTAAAGTAPLVFTAGTNLTTPLAGAVEFNGTHFYGTVGSTRYQLDQQAGTIYTGSNGITLSGTDFQNNLITGIAGGQTVIGGSASANSLTLSSTSHVIKGKIIFGTSAYDELNNRLGVGNDVPTEALDITGNLKFSGALMPNNLSGNTGEFLTSTGAGTAPAWTTFDTTNIAGFSQKVQSLFSSTAPVTYSNGLIGITQATTSTDGYLSSTDWNTFKGKADTANTWIRGGNGVTSTQTIGTKSNFDFPFITNNTEKMRLSAGGNLGIGGTVVDGTNAEKLLVDAGTTSYNVISGKGNLNNYLQLNIKNFNTGTSASSDVVATNDAGTEINGLNYVDMGINSSGNTSTGVLGGANTGYLYSTGSDFSIGNATASKNLLLFTGGTASSNERMRIDGSGNVGIGTTSPSTKLHIYGVNPLTLVGVQTGTATSTDSVLTITSGLVKKLPVSTFATPFDSWSTTGNAGTTSLTNFLGTTDSTKLIMKINNVVSGQLSPNINQEVSFGQGALNSGSGSQNTAMGYYSLSVNTGNFNTAMGNYSLLSNTTGAINTAVGHQSLMNNTSGQYNSAFGAGAMKLATTGIYNSAVGANSMGDPVTGSYNASLGASSMRRLTSGSSNTALGESSLYNNLTGTNNTAIGRSTLSNTTGSNNVAIGFTAGSVNTTGSSNIFIGDNSQPANTALTNAIAIGSRAYVGQSNAMVLGSINGINGATSSTSIGIGNTTPSNTLHVTAAANPLRLEGLQTGAGTDQVMTVDATGVVRQQTIASISALNAWSITGNSGTNSSNFLGTTANASLRLKSNGIQGMILDSLGNVGIGTSPLFAATNPEKLLVDAGTTSYNVISGKGDLNSYLQLNIKNINAGTSASSDVVATNDAGTEANGLNYVDMGVNSSGNTSTGVLGGANTGYLYSTGSDFSIGNATAAMNLLLFTGGVASSNERMRIDGSGNVGIGTTSPTAILHLKAGTTSANTAPLKFTSGSLMTTAEAGGVEFFTDKFYSTITTGAARKEFTLNDIALTSGRVPFATTNGRLTDLSTFTYTANRLSPTYITLGAGTAAAGTAPLVFTSGTNLTTPIAGAVEFNGTHFYGTVGATRYQLDQQAGTTYTGSNGITLTGTDFRNNLTTGIAGGQTVTGGTASANSLTLRSTSFVTKGKILFGTSGYDELNNRLGLGNSIPTEALDVTGNLKFSGALMPGGTAGTAGYFLQSMGAGSAPVWFDASGFAWQLNGNPVASIKTLGTTTAFDLPFITNNTEKMRITTAGNVGIGATTFSGTNPEQLLVDAGATGNTNYQNVLVGKGNTNSYAQLNIQNSNAGTTASSDVVATNDAGNDVNLINYVDMGINSSGNTSTGVLGGANTGYLYSTGSDFAIGNATSSKSLIFFTGGIAANEKMRIDGSGNVGIGTAAPHSTFEVNGSVGHPIIVTSSNITLDASNYTVVLTNGSTPIVTLPAASTCAGRIYVIVNQTNTARTISSYINFSGNAVTLIQSNKSFTVQSDGTNWYLIQ